MRLITDFHLHSKWSRACSKELTIANIGKMCERKGIQFVGTSDFTHPAWRKEIGEELEEVARGTFALTKARSRTRFLLATEISCIYKRHNKTRRVHHLILLSSLSAVDQFIDRLNARGCNLKSDGRPIIGLDSEELLKIVLDIDPKGMLIPAHAWTPWFAVFGSQSGFDSLEECFGEHAKYIPAIETGLSSDPKMNWQLSQLDNIFLVSNSDAHSLENLGREANVFEMTEASYYELYRILMERDRTKFLETIEFFPEEGKYHVDGHRACGFWCEPEQTKKLKGVCPKCGKPLVVGVLNRVDHLADRPFGDKPSVAVPYRSIVPLAELIGEAFGVGKASKKVRAEVDRILSHGHSEFTILLDVSEPELARMTTPEIVESIRRMRAGQVTIRPGYDGEYGVVSLLGDRAELLKQQQVQLF